MVAPAKTTGNASLASKKEPSSPPRPTQVVRAVQPDAEAVHHEAVGQVGDRLHRHVRRQHDCDEPDHRRLRSGAHGAGSSAVSWRTHSSSTAVMSVKPKK